MHHHLKKFKYKDIKKNPKFHYLKIKYDEHFNFLPLNVCNKNVNSGSWRDGLMVKSTNCPSRRPEFNAQQSHGSSHSSVTPASGDLTTSPGGHQYT